MYENETKTNADNTDSGNASYLRSDADAVVCSGDPQGKPTAKKDIQKSGTEVGKAGTSLARNVKHGRIVRGGKRFGQHIGAAGKSVGRGTKTAVKTAVKP